MLANSLLSDADIPPTPNRVIVVRALIDATAPKSLGELEEQLLTLQKSSILRVLNILIEKGLVHTIEDGRGVIKYEICRSHNHRHVIGTPDDDTHVHFYCEKCRRTICIDRTPPPIDMPEGYEIRSLNYMLKGICPRCAHKF